MAAEVSCPPTAPLCIKKTSCWVLTTPCAIAAVASWQRRFWKVPLHCLWDCGTCQNRHVQHLVLPCNACCECHSGDAERTGWLGVKVGTECLQMRGALSSCHTSCPMKAKGIHEPIQCFLCAVLAACLNLEYIDESAVQAVLAGDAFGFCTYAAAAALADALMCDAAQDC